MYYRGVREVRWQHSKNSKNPEESINFCKNMIQLKQNIEYEK